MSKSLHVFCNILQYIKLTEPSLAVILDDLCLGSALKPRGGRGITFLMPTKSSIQTLEKLASSENVEEYDKAINLLKAHILTDDFKAAADFSDDSKAVVNKLGNMVDVDVKGGKVTLAGSALTAEPKFKTSPSNKLAVWRIDGVPPVEGEKFSKDAAAKKKKVKKTGGLEYFGDEGIRMGLARKMEQEFLSCFKPNVPPSKYDPYASVIVNLAYYLDSKYPDGPMRDRLTGMLLRLHPFPIVSFHDWIEPYAKVASDDAMISDEDLAEWWHNAGSQVSASYGQYESLAAKLIPASAYPSGSAPSAAQIENELSYVKTKLLNRGEKTVAEGFKKAYELLGRDGKINNLQVLSKGLAAFHPKLTPEYLMFSDERAYMISFALMSALRDNPVNPCRDLQEAMNELKTSYSGKDITAQTMTLDPVKIKSSGYSSFYSVINCFIISDHLLTLSQQWCNQPPKVNTAENSPDATNAEPFVYTACIEVCMLKSYFAEPVLAAGVPKYVAKMLGL